MAVLRLNHLTQQELYKLYPAPGQFPDRVAGVQTTKLRMSSEAAGRVRDQLNGGGVGPSLDIPQSSFQWLFFDTVDGAVPVGPVVLSFESPPIPFIGGITEVDIISTDPGTDWQMRLSVPGVGNIFQTTQPTDQLRGEGFFRPTPSGFWPETEGIVYPLATAGSRVLLEFSRLTSTAPNLTVRVFIVAHPSN